MKTCACGKPARTGGLECAACCKRRQRADSHNRRRTAFTSWRVELVAHARAENRPDIAAHIEGLDEYEFGKLFLSALSGIGTHRTISRAKGASMDLLSRLIESGKKAAAEREERRAGMTGEQRRAEDLADFHRRQEMLELIDDFLFETERRHKAVCEAAKRAGAICDGLAEQVRAREAELKKLFESAEKAASLIGETNDE